MTLGKGHYWIEINDAGDYTGHICSAYYGEADKPTEGIWILVSKVKDIRSYEKYLTEIET